MLKKLIHTQLLLVVSYCINLIFIGEIYSQIVSDIIKLNWKHPRPLVMVPKYQ